MANFTQFATPSISVAQNDSEWPISNDLQLFQCFPTKVAQNDSEWPISPNLQLPQSQWLRMTQNGQFHPICNSLNPSGSE